jgi:hypothetical protein
MLLTLMRSLGPGYKYEMPLTGAIEHIKQYAKVDVMKLMVVRDTLYNQNGPGQKPYNTHVPAYFTNIAYSNTNHATQDRQGVVRVINNYAAHDYKDGARQYGTRYIELINWSRYEKGNQDPMFLQDLTSKDKVNMYAADDMWVTLPWYTTGQIGPEGEGKISDYTHEKPRESAYNSISCNLFDWNETTMDFENPEYKSMYNEPIVFCRLMAVHDTGSQELVSTDGRQFKVVQLIQGGDLTFFQFRRREEGILCWGTYSGQNPVIRDFHYYNGEKNRGSYLGEK